MADPGAAEQAGTSDDVAWINTATDISRTITAAIPPVFARYATIVIPEHDTQKTRSDDELLHILAAHTPPQPWWLGYLDTGVADIVRPDAATVIVYTGWPYVLLRADPVQARTWRRNTDATPWHSAVPELLFPADRSWLVSTLWDDDWRCVGGSAALVDALLLSPVIDVRAVTLGEDSTPPGHEAT